MKKVFFIGDVALDEYYTADHFPNIKEKIIVHALPSKMGGSIANAACVFHSLGNGVEFLTALNSGEITKKLIAGLNEEGINTKYMVYDDSIPDSKCIIILAEDEHTVFIPTLGLTHFEISDEAYEALCGCDYLYTNFVEIAPLCYKDKDSKAVLSELRKNGVKVFCDLDCAEIGNDDEGFFPYVDTAFLNEQGVRNLSARYGDDWKEKFFDMGLETLVITEAENGCTVWQKGMPPVSVNGNKVDVVDVTGAGDTFGSAFMHAVMRSSDMKLCAEFANFVAARAVTGMGARYGAVSDASVLTEFIASLGGDPSKYDIFLK